MPRKDILMTSIFSIVGLFALGHVIDISNVFAEEEKITTYKMADDIYAVFTFTFKDGIETHEFPVFHMANDFVANSGSPAFSVEGVVSSAPHLHKALDEAFKYRQNSSYEWNYQLFEVDIDFIKNDEIIKTLSYHDCLVDDYNIKTVNDDYESYLSSKSGFAIVDNIDFLCSGLNPNVDYVASTWQNKKYPVTDYGQSSYTFAENVRTFVTFEFDQGMEKLEFPYFELTSGFEEANDNVVPGFFVEGTISKHPLLNKAIDLSRQVSGFSSGSNVDFEATVEFVKDDKVLRTLEYKDCRVSGYHVDTQTDKEEGYAGKSGFAFIEEIDFDCIGLSTKNTAYDSLKRDDIPTWKDVKVKNVLPSHEYSLGTGPRAVATFIFDEGTEVIDFPMFNQVSALKFIDTAGNDEGDTFSVISAPIAFGLTGVVGDFPMLYHHVDDNLSLTSTTGANNFLDLFNVTVELIDNDQIIRGFEYVDCRVVDYFVKSQRDKESSYFKGFALSNTFDFECLGYHPFDPIYDAMKNDYEKAENISSMDLLDTHDWPPGFFSE